VLHASFLADLVELLMLTELRRIKGELDLTIFAAIIRPRFSAN